MSPVTLRIQIKNRRSKICLVALCCLKQQLLIDGKQIPGYVAETWNNVGCIVGGCEKCTQRNVKVQEAQERYSLMLLDCLILGESQNYRKNS
jgi:hypothetical protein